ncbi:hypothetical protein ISCGN_026445 [Ixodes scapularis]
MGTWGTTTRVRVMPTLHFLNDGTIRKGGAAAKVSAMAAAPLRIKSPFLPMQLSPFWIALLPPLEQHILWTNTMLHQQPYRPWKSCTPAECSSQGCTVHGALATQAKEYALSYYVYQHSNPEAANLQEDHAVLVRQMNNTMKNFSWIWTAPNCECFFSSFSRF